MKRLLTIAMVVGLVGCVARVWGKGGSSTGSFLKMGVGGRGVAMGETQTAVVDDASALYWNPAGLSSLTQNEIALMHNKTGEGVTQDVLYYVRPTEKAGVWGVGGSFVKIDGIRGFDATAVETRELKASDVLATLGWGKYWEDFRWIPGLQTGASVKVLKKTLDTESATGAMADLGALYEWEGDRIGGLTLGLTVQNIGTGLTFGGEKTDFPSMIKVGVGYPLFGDNMVVSADLVAPFDGNAFVNVGGEYRVWDMLSFRAGYRGTRDVDSGLTYGFGIGNERLRLDYGFVPFGVFGESHRLSVNVRFGGTYRQRRVTEQVEQAYQRALARYGQGYMVEAYMQTSQILSVAPWHRPAKLLAKRIEAEFKNMEVGVQQEQLQTQVDDHFVRGEQFFQVDDLLRARREFQAILALQPDHLGAKTYLNRIDERFMSLTEKFYDMAVQAFAAQEFPQAGELVDKVLTLNPDHEDARALKQRVNQVLEEIDTYEKNKKLADSKNPLMEEGRSLFEKKEFEAALDRFMAVLELDTTDEEAQRMRDQCKDQIARAAYNAGMRSAREGNLPAAVQWARKALKYKPDYSEAKELLKSADETTTKENAEKSKEIYQQSLDAFLSEGDPQKAYELAVKALELDPNNIEAQRMRDRLANRGSQTP